MFIKWQDLEFEYSPKTPDWFWFIWILSIGIIVFSIINGSMLFSILIFIIAFTISLQAVRKPKIINFEINSTGIIIDKIKYPYKNLKSFWVEEKNEPKIIIKTKNSFIPYIVMPLKNTDETEVNNFLLDYLKKEEHQEPFTYKMMKYF